jgi:hypothetical protein
MDCGLMSTSKADVTPSHPAGSRHVLAQIGLAMDAAPQLRNEASRCAATKHTGDKQFEIAI